MNPCPPSRPTYYIPIHGTWGIDDGERAWWRPKSSFANYAKNYNIIQLEDVPFIWSSDLTGFTYNILGPKTKLTDWAAGGWSLYYYLRHVPVGDRNIIAHSHGLQCVLFAASYGLEINNLISVGSPIRNDMHQTTVIARNKIKHWMHIYDSWDWIQVLGGFGDGRFLGSRTSVHADINHKLKDINHSDVLKVREKIYYWSNQGWFDFLRQ